MLAHSIWPSPHRALRPQQLFSIYTYEDLMTALYLSGDRSQTTLTEPHASVDVEHADLLYHFGLIGGRAYRHGRRISADPPTVKKGWAGMCVFKIRTVRQSERMTLLLLVLFSMNLPRIARFLRLSLVPELLILYFTANSRHWTQLKCLLFEKQSRSVGEKSSRTPGKR